MFGTTAKKMTHSQLVAKAALKTARSASTKAQTSVRKAILRVNDTKLVVEYFLIAVAQAALDAEIERVAGSKVTGTGMSMDMYDSSSDEISVAGLEDKNVPGSVDTGLSVCVVGVCE